MDRRDFVKKSCTVCLAIGAGMSLGMLAGCGAALPVYNASINANKVAVPVSAFDKGDFQIIHAEKFFYNIGLRKETDGTYTALLLRCTHADNQLTPTGNGFKCNLHGSEFNKEGQVTTGPADQPLKRYPTEVANGQIIIHLA